MAGLSSPGIGSNLDVNGIVSKLMAVESQPLTTLDQKEASYQAKLSAFGGLSGSLSAFQNAVAALSNPAKFQSLTASAADSSLLTASAAGNAVAGAYNINVSSLAQAQTIVSAGQTSTSAPVGGGSSTTLTFQFGTISGGTFLKSGSTLGSTAAASGIAANALTINGAAITTSASTTSAKALAAKINLVTGTTGVTATAAATSTGVLAFSDVSTGVGDAYSLTVGNTTLASIGASSGLTAAALDTAITTGAGAAGLAADGITATGSAVGGNLRFTRADGSNISITQTLTNASNSATGGIAGLASGTAKTYTSSVSLASDSAITVGGGNPAAAGLTAGSGVHDSASFTQDASRGSGTVTIDTSNNSLQGIRDAINNANIGVTASIVSDGSASPYHLVLTSNKTGASSSMKITVSGEADLQSLLSYDPADTDGQQLAETTSAQDTSLTVNGIGINSATSNISDAIQGVTLNALKTGSTTLTVARDTSSVTTAVSGFVKAYNDITKTLKDLTAYNPETKEAGPLIGDSAVRSIQTGIRQLLSTSISQLSGSVKTLSDIGVAFQKDGTLAVNSTKLQSAITSNFSDVGALFAAMGTSTDSLVSFVSSTSATTPGKYAVNITALATQGTLTGNADLTGGSTVISSGTTLSVNLDGTAATVALSAGTYTSAELATMVQSAINGTSAFSSLGSAVTAAIDDDGFLKVTSSRYGSASKVTLSNGAGTSAATLIGGGSSSVTGVDVAGAIGGVTATGSGQTLTGPDGSSIEGLKLLINGTTLGSRGTLNFSRGYAFQMDKLIGGFLGNAGLISAKTSGINSTIKDIDHQRDVLNDRLADTEKRYRAQFTALDLAISNMTKTSTFLTQQLASLPKISS